MKNYIEILNQDAERIRKLPKDQQAKEWVKHFELSVKLSPYDEDGELKEGAKIVPINQELGLFRIEYDPDLSELSKEG